MAGPRYFVQEALTSLRRGGVSNLLAVGTIALALFVLGAFVLVTSSLDRLMAGWSAAAEMSVYLQDDITPEQRASVEAALASSGLVERREFVSKAAAGQRFRREFPDLAGAADGLGSNPFPASLEVRLHARAMSSTELARLARSLGQMPGVSDVRYDRQWLDRVTAFIGAVRWAGIVLALALGIAAGLTIAAVVRLAMFGRREEVEIMGLVGAPLGAIRGPFVIEGVMQGGLGALVALVALRAVYEIVRWRVPADVTALGPSILQFLPVGVSVLLVAGGMVVGCVGGYVATRIVR